MENDTTRAIAVLRAVCEQVEQNKDYLCELDAALGDGDHGISMAKSFQAVKRSLESLQGKDLETILKSVGMTLISEVGGAMGPLFGTAFLRAGKVMAGKSVLTPEDLGQMLCAAEEGIVQRGHAKVGDKTMLDALHPAAQAAQNTAADGGSLAEVLQSAANGAAAGAALTTGMIANIGRASRLGERTLGHQDPGATSVSIILAAAAEACTAGGKTLDAREKGAENV
jgi:dihydroxyacetone kinase-like protein